MADQIPDHLAGVLRPGDAEVQVGPSPNEWNPQAGQEVGITVIARPRGRLRVGSQRHVFVRYISPQSSCGASYATARGSIVGPLILSGVGPPPRVPPVDPRGLVGTVNSAGDVVATTGQHYRFNRPGKLRFCIWLGRRAGTRIRPIAEDVVVQGRLFAAVLVHGGSYDVPNHEQAASVATFRFQTVTSTVSPSEPGCPGASTLTESAQRYGTGGYYFGGGIDESGGFSCGPTTVTWSFSSLPTAHAPAQSLGTLTLTDAERAAPVNSSPIFHIGACALIG
ncbi:MAG: hypothetical protein JO243_20845, partial [Solirubrobacterales bacterium]|nr:hypothetical protein [Solirubrobacterales bacterium]